MAIFRQDVNPNGVRKRAAANVSAETHGVTDKVIEWGRRRWPGARVLKELVLGERRVDVVFVCEADLIAVEIKGPKDSLDRAKDQMREYRRFAPEVWLAVAPKFERGVESFYERNLLIVGDEVREPVGFKTKPLRDELSIMRLLELLWAEESIRIAHRQCVLPKGLPVKMPKGDVQKMIARLLSGNDILREVCTELRARPLVGLASDDPTR